MGAVREEWIEVEVIVLLSNVTLKIIGSFWYRTWYFVFFALES